MSYSHEDGFENEAKFHEVLRYLCERDKKVSSGEIKHIISIIDPSMAGRLFERKKCHRWLKNIGENNGFTNGKLYESITFNGATYEIANDSGEVVFIGASSFQRTMIR